MIDVARRSTAASFIGLGRAAATVRRVFCRRRAAVQSGHQGRYVFLLEQEWTAASIRKSYDRCWFEVWQTATGSMARCTLTSSYAKGN